MTAPRECRKCRFPIPDGRVLALCAGCMIRAGKPVREIPGPFRREGYPPADVTAP
jgi:hypothetical protein